MAIITKDPVTKGSPSTFTLDKAALAAHTLVDADEYFSDTDNWYRVSLMYKSDVGGQQEVVTFDATESSPEAEFLVSTTARDLFEIRRLVITDFDGGKFAIDRADLETEDFDVDLGVIYPSFRYFKLVFDSTIETIDKYTGVPVNNSHNNYNFMEIAYADITGPQYLTGKTFTLNRVPESGYGAEFLNDGVIVETITPTPNFTFWSGPSPTLEMVVDMGSVTEWRKLLIAPVGLPESNLLYRIPTNFSVYGSNNNSDFSLVKSFTGQNQVGNTPTTWWDSSFREFSLV